MTPSQGMIDVIERAAFLAWPAAETDVWGPWTFRATSGVTRRANSVWLGGIVEGEITAGVAAAETFYRARGLPSIFQVSAREETASLDRALAARGYAREGEVAVQVAATERVRGAAPVHATTGVTCEVLPTLTEAWLELSGTQGRYRGVEGIYEALLRRLGARARFGLAQVEGRPAAVGLLVLDEATSWAGVFSMHTVPAFRRRGLGRALLTALADEARQEGARHLYLQVEVANAGAQRLYEAAGFVTHHHYHYRVEPHTTQDGPCANHC